MIKHIRNKIVAVVAAGIMIASLSACGSKNTSTLSDGVTEVSVMDRDTDGVVEGYKKTVENSEYIMHALGGMDGKSYINSIDCLRKTYEAGYRLFEADVSYTSDDVLVLAHSGQDNIWSEADWNDRIGIAYPFRNMNGNELTEESKDYFTSNGYDFDDHTCNYDSFMTFRIQGEYTATSFSDIVQFMKEHDDMYLMVDAGNRSYESTQKLYKMILDTCKNDYSVLDRIIAGGQTTDMMQAVKDTYDFPLLNMYYAGDDVREESIYSPEQFINYCNENGIISFSTAKETYNDYNGAALKEAGLISYVFTVNDSDEAALMKSYGADVIGTDFLW